jgi:hypothetical protein
MRVLQAHPSRAFLSPTPAFGFKPAHVQRHHVQIVLLLHHPLTITIPLITPLTLLKAPVGETPAEEKARKTKEAAAVAEQQRLAKDVAAAEVVRESILLFCGISVLPAVLLERV